MGDKCRQAFGQIHRISSQEQQILRYRETGSKASPADIKGHHVAASKDHPEYLVESEKTGKEAAHKPDALERIKE